MCCFDGLCPRCVERRSDEALRALRAKLAGPTPHREGEGDVTFLTTDKREVTIRDVRVDSVGPSASARGVVSVEFFDSDRVVHVPFVESWEFTYRV